MNLTGLAALANEDSLNRDLDRRDFLKVCSLAAAAVGLPASAAEEMADAAAAGKKPSVIWLAYQACTGCTETLLRTSHPQLDELILDLISLDFQDTVMVPSGALAEKSLHEAMEANDGQFVLVIEGSIPTKDDGVYCKVGGKTALEEVREVADRAGAIIAIGSCASWGGIPSADPNPTGAKGAHEVLEGKAVVNIPGCPANPYNFLGTVLQYATFGTLPALDEKNRPLHSYGRTIHEHCPRRPHFDAGRFAQQFGDEGHRLGYCLYKLGCKGPETHAPCSILHFGEVVDAWPIGLGHPCFGCTEEEIGFTVPLFTTADIERPMPPDTYPPISSESGEVSPWATGVAGAALGAAATAGLMAARKMSGDGDTAEETAGAEGDSASGRKEE